ncbi:uncharacterized protein BDV17DRAFT_1651 [Aspergillus undulatus]|uniref:uncharacterized protein n=1 Tax=Aspergillus undulatus TaxID=1810928 RepID=UPI003CCCA1C8
MFSDGKRSPMRTYLLPQDPSAKWLRGQPANHECATCNLCAHGEDCATVDHPYSLRGDTGLRCYQCTQRSHETYAPARAPMGNLTTKAKELPKPYRKPEGRFYPDSRVPNWCVSVVVDIEVECPRQSILEYRVAFAEMMQPVQKSKVVYYKGEQVRDADDRLGVKVYLHMVLQVSGKTLIEEAKETVRGWLRDMNTVWARRMDVLSCEKKAEESQRKLDE